MYTFTWTHTHTQSFYCSSGICPGLPGWAGTRKVKPGRVKSIWIYWSKRRWVAVASAGLYASLHFIPDNHANIPPLSFYRPDALPATQPTASKHSTFTFYLKWNNNLLQMHCHLQLSILLHIFKLKTNHYKIVFQHRAYFLCFRLLHNCLFSGKADHIRLYLISNFIFHTIGVEASEYWCSARFRHKPRINQNNNVLHMNAKTI